MVSHALDSGLGDSPGDDADLEPATLELPPLAVDVPFDVALDRIDRIVAKLFPSYSRARLQQWIEAQRLEVDGAIATSKTRIRGGERIVLRPVAEPQTAAFTPEAIALTVVHEDDTVIVIDKPAGLVVHPAAGNWGGTLLNGLLFRWPELANVPRAGIVHRLDKDTSGLMVVAKTLEAQTALVRQLQARTVRRRYLAVCWGRPANGAIDAPIGRDPHDRLRMAVVPSGKPAITHVKILGLGRVDSREVTLVECSLETGRTHQIRVHLASLGHALLGDGVYASRAFKAITTRASPRQALHAYKLGFEHPTTGAAVEFTAPVPDDLQTLFSSSGIPTRAV